jgi:hypothetical protein
VLVDQEQGASKRKARVRSQPQHIDQAGPREDVEEECAMVVAGRSMAATADGEVGLAHDNAKASSSRGTPRRSKRLKTGAVQDGARSVSVSSCTEAYAVRACDVWHARAFTD